MRESIPTRKLRPDFMIRLITSSFEMPVLPLLSVDSLETTLFSYQQQLLQPRVPRIIANPISAILPYCTENPPLPEYTKNVLSDLFHSFSDLATAATTTDGQNEMRRWLSESRPEQAEGPIAFWLREYIAD